MDERPDTVVDESCFVPPCYRGTMPAVTSAETTNAPAASAAAVSVPLVAETQPLPSLLHSSSVKDVTLNHGPATTSTEITAAVPATMSDVGEKDAVSKPHWASNTASSLVTSIAGSTITILSAAAMAAVTFAGAEQLLTEPDPDAAATHTTAFVYSKSVSAPAEPPAAMAAGGGCASPHTVPVPSTLLSMGAVERLPCEPASLSCGSPEQVASVAEEFVGLAECLDALRHRCGDCAAQVETTLQRYAGLG